MTYEDERAKIRANTQADNEKLRDKMEASEAAVKAPEYQGYTDDGPVEPIHGADSAYDLDLSKRGQKGSPKEPEADLNPAQNAKPKGGA